MSENQTVETSIETEFQPNADGDLKPQSMEDKFFGVKTEIASKEKNEEDVSVEVIDDVPEEDRRPPKQETEQENSVDDEALDKEIADYSKRAGDRINKIKYEYHEERRAKEQAVREQQEAIRNLQTLMAENQKMQAMINQGGQVLNKQATNNAQWAKHNAQERFKKAYEDGNADEMAVAQEELSKATLAEQAAGQYAQSLQSQIDQNFVPELPQQMEQTQLDPAMQDWAQKNAWFMGTEPVHQQMTSYAMYVDQKLQKEGIDPASQSQEYYGKVDKAMRKEFPSFFGVQSTEVEEYQEEEKKQPSNVVAPVSRNSGTNKNPRTIRLSQTQVKLARQLGISPEQYAKQLLKES
tara:strand:+ start:37 stop:1092 length:1056 start_codon:yes stop_codon:yes gene_type:complete